MVFLPSMQYLRVDGNAIDVFVLCPATCTPTAISMHAHLTFSFIYVSKIGRKEIVEILIIKTLPGNLNHPK